ncbi:MAG: phage tail protein [Chloroflexi bacterium]|nr:MAG: phage tail protein [Phototrophicales bacterium]RMF82203.1 MAG: phage tail protein [Chloroflexota bacterium]
MDRDVLDNLFSAPEDRSRFYGVTVGLVTNNKDEAGMGRVKVKFPWLSDEDESFWARIAVPMAGKQMGTYFLPEVNDEVLVAFEHGRVEYPYIIGALWNGKDKPPESNDDGKNNMRTMKSRSGHIIRFDDTDGDEKIEILDKSGKNTIVIKVKENDISITSEGTLTLKAKQDITIESSGGKLIMKANGIDANSKADVAVQASTKADFKAGSQLNIKGAMVNIN